MVHSGSAVSKSAAKSLGSVAAFSTHVNPPKRSVRTDSDAGTKGARLDDVDSLVCQEEMGRCDSDGARAGVTGVLNRR